MKTHRLTSYMLGISFALLLSASSTLANEAMVGRGVLIDGSGVTPEKVAALQALLQSENRQAPRPRGGLETQATRLGVPKFPVVTCYAEGTPEETVARLEAERAGTELEFNPSTPLWVPSAGTPVHLTVSFVPDGTLIPATGNASDGVAGNSVLFARMDALFAGVGGRTAWTTAIMQAFDRWAALTGTSYTFVSFFDGHDDGASFPDSPEKFEETGPLRGDIRIAMRNIDGLGTVLAFNFFPLIGDMVLDSSEDWARDPLTSFLRLRNVVGHEHGHGLGLKHVCPVDRTKLLEPFVSTAFDGPQQDDIRGIHDLYGDAQELNGSSGSAVPLGTITLLAPALPSPSILPATVSGLPTPNARRTCIERASDSDFFKFSTLSSWVATVTVTPIGSTYKSGLQNADATCSAGSNVAALSQADLAFEVLRFNCRGGLERIVFSNTRGLGGVETLTFPVTTLFCGTTFNNGFFIRVFANGTVLGPQLYDLSVSGSEPIRLEASQGTFRDRVVLSWTDIPGINRYEVLRNTTEDLESATKLRTVGASQLVDTDVAPDQRYHYWLVAVVTESGEPQVIAGPATGYAQDPAVALNGSRPGSGVDVPARVSLAVQPNPGYDQQISFGVPRRADVELGIFDISGRRVAVLTSGTYEPGTYRLGWDGRTTQNRPAAVGIYFYTLRVGKEVVTVRAIRLN